MNKKPKNSLIIEYRKMSSTVYGKHAGVYESHKNVKSLDAANGIISRRNKSNIVSATYAGTKICNNGQTRSDQTITESIFVERIIF